VVTGVDAVVVLFYLFLFLIFLLLVVAQAIPDMNEPVKEKI
jgi:hypothetical protein